MAVPKKKISVSRKRTRLNSKHIKMQNYTQCNKSLKFIPLHRKSLCEEYNK
jgi:ribosomal protein L32